MKVKMFPLSGGLGGMAFDITELETARETLEKNSKAHDDTLNHVADGVAIFGGDRKLIFNNRAFQEMWGARSRLPARQAGSRLPPRSPARAPQTAGPS
jgi:PAS domain-containing protein